MMSSNPVVVDVPRTDTDEAIEPLPRDTVKVSWGSIIAGLVVALGAWVLLSVLGLAIGLSSVDPSQPSSLRTGGAVSGIWSLIVPFAALLVGGLVSARTAGIVSRATGAIHGVVLWALATIAGVALIGAILRGVLSAAMGADIELDVGGSMMSPMDAATAADRTGKAMWWVFIGMVLGLGSAVVGSTLGVSRRQRLAATPHLSRPMVHTGV